MEVSNNDELKFGSFCKNQFVGETWTSEASQIRPIVLDSADRERLWSNYALDKMTMHWQIFGDLSRWLVTPNGGEK